MEEMIQKSLCDSVSIICMDLLARSGNCEFIESVEKTLTVSASNLSCSGKQNKRVKLSNL